MTKKDYDLIAGVVREEVEFWQRHPLEEPGALRVLLSLASTLSAKLGQQNSAFKKTVFMEHCGLG